MDYKKLKKLSTELEEMANQLKEEQEEQKQREVNKQIQGIIDSVGNELNINGLKCAITGLDYHGLDDTYSIEFRIRGLSENK